MVSISYFRNLWLKVGDKRIGHRTIPRPLAVILMTAPLPPVLNRPWLTRRLHYAPPIGRHRSSLLTRKGTFIEFACARDRYTVRGVRSCQLLYRVIRNC